jgi:hypothetical protein
VTLPGVSATLTGGASDTLELADFFESATLVAFTVTVWAFVMETGAVYKPIAEILPIVGLSDQVTAGFEAFATVAVNICVCAGASVALPGIRATLTGTTTLKILEAIELLSEALIAIALTVPESVRAIGPEYGWEASDGELPSMV